MIRFNNFDSSEFKTKIFCGMTHKEYKEYKKSSFHLPESYTQERFIHCCKFDQLTHVSEKHFDEDQYFLLVMNESLGEKLKYEGENELFPHLYRKIDSSEVLNILHIDRIDQKTFEVSKIEGMDV